MKKIMLLVYALSIEAFCFCQNKYPLANEVIVGKPKEWRQLTSSKIIGDKYGKVVIYAKRGSAMELLAYDETSGQVFPEKNKLDKKSKLVSLLAKDNLYACTGFSSLPDSLDATALIDLPIDELNYQDLWVIQDDVKRYIDRLPVNFIDKYYQIKLSYDQQYLICNPFNERTIAYDAQLDNSFYLYNLAVPNREKPQKEKVSCDSCSNTFIVGENFIFQRDLPVGNGFDGTVHNIYLSSRKDVQDTTRLASDVELLLISPDGKYALGSKFLFGKKTLLLIDLTVKRFSYLIGRDYWKYEFFFSPAKKMFCFDTGSHLVYMRWPNAFEHDALKIYNIFSTKSQDEQFWNSKRLPPLD